jgi:preprotein translocase subunit SecY
MFRTLRTAFQVKEIRQKFLYTALIVLIFRLGCSLPAPGVNTAYFSSWLASQSGDAFNFFNAITGGSFSQLSVFALSISPYITSSIIVQLLTIAIPALEEMSKDGEDGKQKINKLTRILTVVLALIQGTAMSIGFGSQGMITNYTWYNVVVVVATWTAGASAIMWLGERITAKGIGNGISIILLVNILSSIPNDFYKLYEAFMKPYSVFIAVIAAIVIVAIILAMVIFTIYLQDGERRIPVQYAQKVQGRKMVGGQSSNIPIKVNTAGVIPVIFASSLMSTPVVIASFFSVNYDSFGGKILKALSSSNWINPSVGWGYSVGLIVYLALVIMFAYFYTSITFNPIEIATNMKKQGGFVPGIRPGKPTSDYLDRILNYMVFIGAVGLIIVAIVPIIFSGLFGISSLSFFGTSLIIIVGVVLETIKAVESMMLVRNYKGFLNN